MNVIDSGEIKKIIKLQKESESGLYSDEDNIEIGNILFAKSYITITTTRNNDNKYSLAASIYNIETSVAEGGFSSKKYYDESDFLTKSHGEVAAELLIQLGVNLTPNGKLLINPPETANQTKAENVKQSSANLSVIEAELKRLEQELQSLTSKTDSSSLAEAARKETQSALLKQKEAYEKERIERLNLQIENEKKEAEIKKDRDSEQQKKIDALSKQIKEKASQLQQSGQYSSKFEQKLILIENEKSTYAANKKSIEKSISDYNSKMHEECRSELRKRKNQKPRRAELNPDGTLNENGKKVLDNDLRKIQKKYDDLCEANKSRLYETIGSNQENLIQQIRNDLKDLSNTTFTASSVTNSDLYLTVNEYDGSKNGWAYSLKFILRGQTLFSTSGILTYKSITGKNVCNFPADDDPNFDEKVDAYYSFIDNVDLIDSFFRMSVPYIQANITYTVKPANYYEASKYIIEISKTDFVNLQTDTLCGSVAKQTFDFTYKPSTLVDWRTEAEVQHEIVKKTAALKAAQTKYGFVMKPVEGGSFTMGSSETSAYNLYHDVKLNSFEMSETEITQKFYEAVMNSNPSSATGLNYPVGGISWLTAILFCNELSKKCGLTPCYTVNGNKVTWNQKADGYRLPTEAEWEYAARGGINHDKFSYSGTDNISDVNFSYSKDVKSDKPNSLGIYGLSYGIKEWCWDVWGSFTSTAKVNPVSPDISIDNGYHCLRYGKISDRNYSANAYNDFGFRIVRSLP